MELEKNKDVYPLPAIGQLASVIIKPHTSGLPLQCCIVLPDTMVMVKRMRHHGTPTRACVLVDASQHHSLQLDPTPDEDGELIVRYYPPMMEV